MKEKDVKFRSCFKENMTGSAASHSLSDCAPLQEDCFEFSCSTANKTKQNKTLLLSILLQRDSFVPRDTALR
jgi:hypothetical protein